MSQCHNVTINANGFMKTCKRLSPKRTDSSVSSRPFLSRVLRRQLFNSVFTGFKLSNYFFCIKANSDVFIVQICMLDTLDEFIISCIFCQSGHAVLFLLHNYLHPDNGRRLLRELQKEMLHRVHSDKVKYLCQPQKIIMVTLSSVEETIEKCYHPMERLCAPPAYGEEPAEVILNSFLI